MIRGSYNTDSYIALHDLGTSIEHDFPSDTKRPFQGTTLDVIESSNKLNEIEENLEDFDLEELRNEFFDATFGKPDKFTTTYDEDDEVHANIKSKSTFEIQIRKSLLEKLFGWNLKDRSSLAIEYYKCWSNKSQICKYFVAYFIAIIICVIHPSGEWIGHQYRCFLPLSVLIHHPVRSVGVQLELTLESIIGASFGMGWSSLAWYVSTATAPASNHQGGLLFLSLITALLFSTWLNSYFQRSLYFSKSFSIPIIFLHTAELVTSKNDLRWKLFWDFGLSYLFGILLSLIVCFAIFPHAGNQELVDSFDSCVSDTKAFLVSLLNPDYIGDQDKLEQAQRKMINSLNIGLSEAFREFSNQISMCKFDPLQLESLRNSLTRFLNPLRVLPLNCQLFYRQSVPIFYEMMKSFKTEITNDMTPDQTSLNESSDHPSEYNTPRPKNFEKSLNQEECIEILRKEFSFETFVLICEMIYLLEHISDVFKIFRTKAEVSDIQLLKKKLLSSKIRLSKKVKNLNKKYRLFTQSDHYDRSLLREHVSVDIFLFLKNIKNAADHLIQTADDTITLTKEIRWRLVPFNYPLHRAIHRLPKQCSLDEGAGNVLNYFGTINDVEEIFERIYNSYTSRHKYSKNKDLQNLSSIKAIDHDDFSLHTTTNQFRLKLWKFTTMMVGDEMKWAMKKTFIMVFLCLPSWLPLSYHWYQEYQCWWAPMAFYLLSLREYSGNWDRLTRRVLLCLIGIFWGWAANQARHFGSPYVICTFAGLLTVPMAIDIIVYNNTKSGFTTMMSFSVIVMEPYSKGSNFLNTAGIWKCTWVTGLAFIIAILLSMPVNWIMWSFTARTEVRLAVSTLLLHVSQSYQAVTDRYLYRDSNDAPTELTLALSHIREVRLSQSIVAIRELLEKSKLEPNYIKRFNHRRYEEVLNLCETLLDQIVEARISGSNFEVWEQDAATDVTRALLSLRRDSVSSVIFVLYMLSNCYRSKTKVPLFLPNPILARKKLFKFINKFEMPYSPESTNEKHLTSENINLLHRKLLEDKYETISQNQKLETIRWKMIHRLAFERAFTNIAQLLQDLTIKSKEILGEESY